MKNRKDELMRATIEIVAKDGLSNFSMRKVTEKIGVSEALIYKYFGTKDQLLYDCFMVMHKDLAAVFDTYTIPPITSDADFEKACEMLFRTYFEFLIQGKERTIYYFEYRDSAYINEITESCSKYRETNCPNLVKIFDTLKSYQSIDESIEPHYLWTYILDTSGIFAKRVIRGELPDTEYTFSTVWKLISRGIYGKF